MFSLHTFTAALLGSALFAVLAGCGRSSPPQVTTGTSPEAAAYLLASEPMTAKGVKELRSDAKEADEVTLVGRIGGDTNPWIDGQAAFLLVDNSLKPCNEQHDDACPTPWDYCCDADTLTECKALVKVVDSSGKTVAGDARQLFGLKELQTVVVHGKAKRDEVGNLTVLADGIFVRR